MIRAAIFVLLFALTNLALVLLYPFSLSRFVLCAAVYTPGTLVMLYLLFHPRNSFLVTNRCQVPTSGKRSVALTFDDGPSEEHTPKLLRILRERGVKATFFVIGKKVAEHPELVRQIVSDGNRVGNHTYSHPSLFCFLSPGRLRAEIEKGQQAILSACNISPTYFRSPVGLRHVLIGMYLKEAGLEFISWRVRGFDTRIQQPEAIARRITEKISPGDIILLHDKSGEATERMLEALPRIIDELKTQGYEFVLV